jgi:hypothetical protein
VHLEQQRYNKIFGDYTYLKYTISGKGFVTFITLKFPSIGMLASMVVFEMSFCCEPLFAVRASEALNTVMPIQVVLQA